MRMDQITRKYFFRKEAITSMWKDSEQTNWWTECAMWNWITNYDQAEWPMPMKAYANWIKCWMKTRAEVIKAIHTWLVFQILIVLQVFGWWEFCPLALLIRTWESGLFRICISSYWFGHTGMFLLSFC